VCVYVLVFICLLLISAIFVPDNTTHIKYRYCVFSGGKFVRFEGQGDRQLERTLNIVQSDDGTNATNDYLDTVPVSDDRLRRLSSRSSYDVGASDKDHRTRQFAVSGRMKETIKESDSVIVVSYFLPIILDKIKGKWTATWNYEHILSFQTSLRVKWVGSVLQGSSVSPEDEELITQLLRPMNCYPIFVDPNTHKNFYDVFCKQMLWPVFHHNVGVYDAGPEKNLFVNSDQSDKNLWYTYTTVNHKFRTKVVEVYSEGDLIWIHGFHLLLLPSFLRRRIQRAKIGLFLHTPFPSSEIWKTLWCREDLLRGMLASDQLGFHLYEYARHFLTTCRRLLGTHYEMSPSGFLTIMSSGREVRLSCCHAGVDVYHIRNQILLPEFLDAAVAWKKKFEGKVIISSIDRLERLKGIPLQLITLEKFATEYPQWAEKVVFVIIGVSAPERVQDYQATLRDVSALVRVINNKFPKLIHFEEHPESGMNLLNRLTLFSVTNIMMVNATRDGLNRYPMEYSLARFFAGKAYCQEPECAIEKATAALTGSSYVNLMSGNNLEEMLVGHSPSAPCVDTISKAAEAGFEFDGGSAVVCSEFVSCARVMRGAFTINPWRGDEVITTLLRALELSPVEKGRRTRRNLEFCERMSSFCWAENVLQDLKQTVKLDVDDQTTDHSTLGLGINYRVTEFKSGFKILDTVKLTKHYRQSQERLILLDWGGTLVAENDIGDKFQYYAVATGHASRAGPSEEVKNTLRMLCQDTRNTIFVISGKDLYALTDAFGDVEGLGLVAEHGCYFKWPKNVSGDRFTYKTRKKWQTMLNLGDVSWMNAVRKIMSIYVERTHGTYIEQKGSAIIFQFRDADPEFGYLQSKELEENLADVVISYPIEIIRGGGVDDGYIEVRPKGLSKGLFLKHAMSILSSQGKSVDFVLGVGDDISDEPLFESMHHLKNMKGKCFSVTVGKKVSAAKAYVDDSSAVQELLWAMHKTSQRYSSQLDRKYFSALDLTSTSANFNSQSDGANDIIIEKGGSSSLFPVDFDESRTKVTRHTINSTNNVQVRISTANLKRSSSDGRLTRERAYSTDQHEQSKTELFDFLKSSTFSPTLSPPTLSPDARADMYHQEAERATSARSMYNIDEQEEDEEEGIFF
jgi:trehalose 6-phosphate synthase/phosphatase